MGKHAGALPAKQLSKAVKVNLIANPFGIMAYSFPNVSIAILLNRLLAPNRIRTWALYSLASLQCIIAAVSYPVYSRCVFMEFDEAHEMLSTGCCDRVFLLYGV